MTRPAAQAARLLALAAAAAVEVWRDPAGDPWATVPVGTHREHHRADGRAVRQWLARAYHAAHGRPPAAQAVTDAAGLLAGEALARGETHATHTRVAYDGCHVWIDCGDPEWRAIEVAPAGWSVVPSHDVPVRFRRPRGLRPLAAPERGGSLDELRELLAVDTDTWHLLAGWLVGALAPAPPYLVLVLAGEQGAGKSVRARMLRRVIDPHVVELRRPPRDERDAAIAASNGWVLAVDNLSGLPAWLSDTLCCVASGGGYATRALYTDTDETLVELARPVILTGIEPAATRGDLLDRAVVVTLPPPRAHVAERELWARVAASEGRVLGALLDAAVVAMHHRAVTEAPTDLRMADAAQWIAAAEPALGWPRGTWVAAYRAARSEAREVAVEASPVATAVVALAREVGTWDGTPAELLGVLARRAGEAVVRSRAWPTTPRGLAAALRRAAPDLRAVGVDVTYGRAPDRTRTRRVCIRRRDRPDRPNRPHVADSDGGARGCASDGLDGRSDGRTIPGADRPHVTARNHDGSDDADDADGSAGRTSLATEEWEL